MRVDLATKLSNPPHQERFQGLQNRLYKGIYLDIPTTTHNRLHFTYTLHFALLPTTKVEEKGKRERGKEAYIPHCAGQAGLEGVRFDCLLFLVP